METLNIGGKEFVKARVIAKEFNYTSDYIGQLCRGGKVDAQLVGRTWYVERQSLLDHKENRYRKTPNDFEKKMKKKESPNFYVRAKQVSSVRYDTDQSDLIPTIKADKRTSSTELDIELADAKNVGIKSKTEDFDFETPERSRVVFKGDLVVEDLPEIEFKEAKDHKVSKASKKPVAEPEKLKIKLVEGNKEEVELEIDNTEPKTAAVKKVPIETDDAASETKPSSFVKRLKQPVAHLKVIETETETGPVHKIEASKDDTKAKSLPIEPVSTGVLKEVSKESAVSVSTDIPSTDFERKLQRLDETELTTENALAIEGDTELVQPVKISYLVGSALVALFIVSIMLGFQNTIYITDQVVLAEYSFRVNELLASVYGSR